MYITSNFDVHVHDICFYFINIYALWWKLSFLYAMYPWTSLVISQANKQNTIKILATCVSFTAVGFKVSRHRIGSAPASLYSPHHSPSSSSPSLKPPSHYLYSTPPATGLGCSPTQGGRGSPNGSYMSQFSVGGSPSSQGSFLSLTSHSLNQVGEDSANLTFMSQVLLRTINMYQPLPIFK